MKKSKSKPKVKEKKKEDNIIKFDYMKTNKNNFLVRDKYSKAIINTNIAEVNQYYNKLEDKKRISSLEMEVQYLKKQLDDIKNLLFSRN